MIFYFSGTGNSQWAAEQIGALTGDTVWDIGAMREAPPIREEKQIGLVFPIYAWGVPEPVLSFAAALERTDAFTFGVCTCGEEAGQAMKKLSRIYPLRSSYSLVMPNNYIIGGDVDDGETARGKIRAAYEEIQRLSQEILRREPVYRVTEGKLAGIKSSLVNFGFNKFARGTASFRTGESCTGCGLCARNCPASAISMRDGKPVWAGQCYQCLRCINRCPQEAIQYGTSTEKRSRYRMEDYLQKD